MSTSKTPALFADFPAATDADWRKAAEEGLAGASFEKKLITRTPEGIDLQPIYSRADGEKLSLPEAWPGLAPYVRGIDPLGSRVSGWYICQEPGSRNLEQFNAALQHDLLCGQNAVSLPLDTATRLGLDSETAKPAEVADRGLSIASLEDIEAAAVRFRWHRGFARDRPSRCLAIEARAVCRWLEWRDIVRSFFRMGATGPVAG